MTYTSKLEQLTAVNAIRGGLVAMIPVLITGAFSLILQTFPVEVYLGFVQNFAGGIILEFLQMIYSATFGMLSVYMTFFIARAYMKLQKNTLALGRRRRCGFPDFFLHSGRRLSPGFQC